MSRPRESLERDSPWLLLLLAAEFLTVEFLAAEFLTRLQSKEGWMASPGPFRVSLAVVWVVVMAVVQFRWPVLAGGPSADEARLPIGRTVSQRCAGAISAGPGLYQQQALQGSSTPAARTAAAR